MPFSRNKGCLLYALLALLIVAFLLLIPGRLLVSKKLADQMNPYQSFKGDPIIARLIVSKTGTNHRWKVQIYTPDNPVKLIGLYQPEPCDHWDLQADIISIQPGLALGVPSGWYVLTMLIGTHCYNSHGIVDASIVNNIPIDSNTGPVTHSGEYGGMVRFIVATSNTIQSVGTTYDVNITPTSLSLSASNSV